MSMPTPSARETPIGARKIAADSALDRIVGGAFAPTRYPTVDTAGDMGMNADAMEWDSMPVLLSRADGIGIPLDGSSSGSSSLDDSGSTSFYSCADEHVDIPFAVDVY